MMILSANWLFLTNGSDGRTRTGNQRFRKPLLYPIELHPNFKMEVQAGIEPAYTVLQTATIASIGHRTFVSHIRYCP